MIQGFLQSWDLFHNTYLAGWEIGFLLSLAGVLVVARSQIFVSAAVSQASTFGIALGMWLGERMVDETFAWLRSDSFLSGSAIAFAMVAALLTSREAGRETESTEAITGWVFLVSASVSVLLLSHNPHGLEEIHRLLSSSLIGATPTDVGSFAILAALTLVMLSLYHRRLLLVVLDPITAQALGINTRAWLAGASIVLGLVTGLSIRSAGMLYTFGCLILPALVAKNLCREIRMMFIVAPCTALASGGAGFILANHYDLPPAQMTVALLCLLLLIVWPLRAWIPKHSSS
jgi:ABC-type Mn2+/Zn2+ transport systems, permease components